MVAGAHIVTRDMKHVKCFLNVNSAALGLALWLCGLSMSVN